MKLSERIDAFNELGERLNNLSPEEKGYLTNQAHSKNPWFIPENVQYTLKHITNSLKKENLIRWLEPYNPENTKDKKIGVVMAGNLPFVGFHDYLSVLISGNKLLAKLSHQDEFLPKKITKYLIEIAPEYAERIEFVDRLKNFDAIIATGSDNTSRYFEYYFSKYPNIIRKNRTSLAIISGNEDKDDLFMTGDDIFRYFGLGCRNISKFYLPEGYQIEKLIQSWEDWKEIINHHKYANNYDYNKSVFLMNQTPHLDNGFCLLQENEALFSPLAVIFYEFYKNNEDLNHKLNQWKGKIQCIVADHAWHPESIPFGMAQKPALWDYADNVDTMKFLTNL